MTQLESERLVGEPAALRHLDFAVSLFSDPGVVQWIWPVGRTDAEDIVGPRTPEQTEEILHRFAAHWSEHGFGWWFLRERASGEFVGEVGLQHTEVDGQPAVEIGWTLLESAWGRGYATEAATVALQHGFHTLGLDEVVAFTMTQNLASRGVMEKLGMAYSHDIERAGLPHVLYRLRSDQWFARLDP